MDYLLRRTDYLCWDEYFMATALLAAQRSKDPVTQVGACLVNGEHRIIGVGYNGFPKRCSDDDFPWAKNDANPYNNKHMYVCHAEVNAILNINSANIKGDCTMFVTLFPCNECAKYIIQSGIGRVVFLSDKNKDKYEAKAAKMMFQLSGVKYLEMPKLARPICLDFKLDNFETEFQNKLSLSSNNDSGTSKRNNYLKWQDFFMATTILAAQKSKNPTKPTGACIVNADYIIVGIGYNGFPQKCSDDILLSTTASKPFENTYVCHAIANAIINKNVDSLKNCSLYVDTFPCNECTKLIIQSDIGIIWYLNDNCSTTETQLKLEASKRMLKSASVKYDKYTPNVSRVLIDFNKF